MLGDIRIPEGPKTSPPQLGIVVVGVVGVGVVGVAKMVCSDPFKDCMSYETAQAPPRLFTHLKLFDLGKIF